MATSFISPPSYPRHNELVAALAFRGQPRRLGDAILVPTDVLLPNGTNLVAVVEGGKAGDRITVTDAGAALSQVADAGLEVSDKVLTAAKSAAGKRGTVIEAGALRFGPVPLEEARLAVVMLANTARDVAEAALQMGRKHEQIRFRERVRMELARIFNNASVQAGATLIGASTDKHRFDYLVALPGGRRLALDVPLPDHNSVAAVTLRQLDLKAAELPGMRQAIAYDDRDRWPSSTLMQLRLANVPVVHAGALESGLKEVAGY